MSQPISGFLFDQEMKDAGFTRHEMSNQRLRDAAYRILVRGRLYRFNDADEIEYGVSGPFNDDESRSADSQDERAASLDVEVRAFLENLAKANSEPLNSVAAYRDRASRVDCMLSIRNHARALLARAASSAPSHASAAGAEGARHE